MRRRTLAAIVVAAATLPTGLIAGPTHSVMAETTADGVIIPYQATGWKYQQVDHGEQRGERPRGSPAQRREPVVARRGRGERGGAHPSVRNALTRSIMSGRSRLASSPSKGLAHRTRA